MYDRRAIDWVRLVRRILLIPSKENNVPIHIDDTEKFLDEVSSLYFEVVNDYYNEYQKLRSSRKIEKVLEI